MDEIEKSIIKIGSSLSPIREFANEHDREDIINIVSSAQKSLWNVKGEVKSLLNLVGERKDLFSRSQGEGRIGYIPRCPHCGTNNNTVYIGESDAYTGGENIGFDTFKCKDCYTHFEICLIRTPKDIF